MRHTLLRSRGTARTRAAALVIGLGALSWVILSVVRGASTGRRDAVLHAGTVLICELEHTVSTRTASVGDGVGVRLSEPVAFNGHTIVSLGAIVHGEVIRVAGGGPLAGPPELTIHFTELRADGDTYPITTAPIRIHENGEALESAAAIDGRAVVGGVSGGGAGPGVAVATEGDGIVLPVGQRVRLRLASPVTVRYRAHGS